MVIIGGGSVGLETAELLAAAGKQVTVLEMLDTLAAKMVNVTRTIVLGHLKGYGVRLLTSCRCQEITDRSVIYFVVNRFQVGRMKEIVHTVDPLAYITIIEVADVFSANADQ